MRSDIVPLLEIKSQRRPESRVAALYLVVRPVGGRRDRLTDKSLSDPGVVRCHRQEVLA